MGQATRAYTPAGVIAAASGTFAWGVGVVLVKLTTSPFMVVTFWRHVFSIPIFFVLWALSSDRRLPWRVAGVGGALFAAHQIANFAALHYSTAAVVTIFFSLQPIIVGATGRRFTGERTTPRFYLWSLVAVAGCAILVVASTGTAKTSMLGTILAVANLLLWSAYYLATKRGRDVVGTISWLFVMLLVSGAIIGALTLVTRQPIGAPHGREWTYLAAIAIVPGTIGHLLVTWAHPRIHAAASSAIVLGVPIVASIGSAIFAHEPFSAIEAIGAAIALAGAAAAMRHLPAPVAEEAAARFGEVAT